ncbi:MAG: cell division protein FtsL [Ignavibacteria bacterium]|jgi:cell division protein FtsL|nr:cell division protein FtsL [Ignavibacteria bacterium]MDH7527372.1 cell division protein FtsL [Ignavibacteria bacterium]
MKINQGCIFVFIFFVAFSIIFYVAAVVSIRNYAKEIDKKKTELEVLLNENKELRTIYESLIARDRIVSIAKNQLGMIELLESPEELIISKERIKSLEEN